VGGGVGHCQADPVTGGNVVQRHRPRTPGGAIVLSARPGGARGHLNRLGLTVALGRPTSLIRNKLFHLFKLPQVCKLQNQPFPCSKIYQTFQGGSLNHREQHPFWKEVQIPNRI
jgi:hypothetical protein